MTYNIKIVPGGIIFKVRYGRKWLNIFLRIHDRRKWLRIFLQIYDGRKWLRIFLQIHDGSDLEYPCKYMTVALKGKEYLLGLNSTEVEDALTSSIFINKLGMSFLSGLSNTVAMVTVK
jgi:hypothetical protein